MAQWDTENGIEWAGENWMAVNTPVADAARRAKELADKRRTRYETSHPHRNHHADGEAEKRKMKQAEYPFCAWDGEQPQDTGYSLFGNSFGMEICYPHLSSLDCLNLIIDTRKQYPYAIHVSFGFNFDVSWIINDLPWRNKAALKKNNRTMWKGFELEHIPHKWFKVTYGMYSVKIFDVYSFFMSSLVVALEDWKIGPWNAHSSLNAEPANAGSPSSRSSTVTLTPQNQESLMPSLTAVHCMTERELVETFKSLRASFKWENIAQVRLYMRLELKYMNILMQDLRNAFLDAGYLPVSWHGPGALARMALRRHNISASMKTSPADVQIAARYAYIGGRFSPFLVGHIKGTIHCYDRRSAYPFAILSLPNLSKGTWRRVSSFEPGKFAVYNIRYSARAGSFRIYPLPKRNDNGDVCWPYRVTGWYWTPEAELVADDLDAEFLEGWVFDEDNPEDKPFAWIADYYKHRALLKRLGNPAQYTFKLILNAVYGQLAQRAGWDKQHNRAPRSHQLEWAGYITSHCRAAIWKLTQMGPEGSSISVDTDGIMTTYEIPEDQIDIGEKLGQWEHTVYDEGVFWQSGMYGLRQHGSWTKAKTRGIPRGTYDPAQMVELLERGEYELKMIRHKFVGYGLAMNQKHLYNTWVDEEHSYVLGGNGKVVHSRALCDKICHDGVHRMINVNVLDGPYTDDTSRPHYLPWLAAGDDMRQAKRTYQDLTLFDMNDNDEWEIHT